MQQIGRLQSANQRKRYRYQKQGLSCTGNLTKKIDDGKWSNYKLVPGAAIVSETKRIRKDNAPEIPHAYMAYEIIFISDGPEKTKAVPNKVDKRFCKLGIRLYRNKLAANKRCSVINIKLAKEYKREVKATKEIIQQIDSNNQPLCQ